MKTKQMNIYSIDELTPDCQNRAYRKWKRRWSDMRLSIEQQNTLAAIESRFGIEVYSVELDDYSQNYDHKFVVQKPEAISDLTEERLYAYLVNNFSDVLYRKKIYRKGNKERESSIFFEEHNGLTNHPADNYFLQRLRWFLSNTPEWNYYDVMDECLNVFFYESAKERLENMSKETFLATCRKEQYGFLENGCPIDSF